ncbi:MAG: PAS domain S-box protein [Rhodospirillaceae bacterium]
MAVSSSRSRFPGRLPKSNARLIFLASFLLILEAGLGYFGFMRYQADFLAERKSRLESIAILESARLSQWLAGRLSDASLLSRDTEFGAHVKEAMDRPGAGRGEIIRHRLELLKQAYNYSHVAIADVDGRIVASTAGSPASLVREELGTVRKALRQDAAIASTVHRKAEAEHDLNIAAPIHGPGGERLPAVVLLEIDTDKLVAARSLERRDQSAETLLVRIEGKDIYHLNRVRHPDAATPFSADHVELVAAQAARGARGVVAGVDYRGAAVLAAIAEVPHTDWLLITKVDAAEVGRLIRYRAGLLVGAFLTMLLLAAIAVYQTLRRREAAARLHAQEERARLAAIVEGADDAIVSTDLDRTITSWNPAAERLFGYTAAEAVGRHIRMLLPPGGDEETEASLARVAGGETVTSHDVVRIAKDGRSVDVSVTRSPIMDDEGRIIGVARIYRDIREQKRAAAAQQRLAAIVEHSNDAMVTRTMDGIVTSWNAGAARMFGYTAQEAIGRHVSFLHPRRSMPAIDSANERLCRGESIPPFRSERVTKDGRSIDVLTSVSPLRGASGEVEGASLIFQDMSQLRQAEIALSQSEQRLRAAFDQAAVGMALRSADPENPRWLRVNQKLCDILGYSEAELLQMTSLDVTPPDDVPASIENNRKLVDGSVPAYTRNKRYVRKDGREIWVNLSLSIVRNELGTPLHVVSVVEDITARKAAEEALAEAQNKLELAVASAEVGFWDRNLRTGEVTYSREWKAQLGYGDHEVANVPTEFARLCHPDDLAHSRAVREAALRDKRTTYDNEFRMRHKDGSYRWILSRASVHRDEKGEPVRIIGGHIDITEQKKTETLLSRWTSFYAALSETNEAIVRIRDPEELFKRVCAIAVEKTGLLAAWIGILDEETNLVRPIATAGAAADYAVDITASVDPRSPAGHGPSGRSIRENRAHVVADFMSAETTDYWRQRAARRGIRSGAAFPLRRNGRPCGCLSLYAAEANFFDAELVRLLGEMASDISFAMENMESERQRQEAEARVRESEARYRMLVGNFPDGAVMLFDRDLRCQIADGAAFRLTGRDPQEFVGRPVSEAFPVSARSAMNDYFRRALCGHVIETTVGARGGRDWSLHILPVHEADGVIAAGMVIARDFTDKRRVEEQLRLSALAFENIADGVMITDADNRVVSINKAYTSITGYAEEEVLGKTPAVLYSDKQDSAFYQGLWERVRREGRWQGEVWSRRKNGEIYPEFLSISALKDESGATTHYVSVFNDISQFKAYEEHLEYLAHHDPLTGLPNRTLLEDRVEIAIANAERKHNHVALLFVDLDRFKLINDTLGHAIGDELLIAIARRLGECVRAADTVSRHGGDEFLVLLPEIHHVDDAARIAEKLMEEVARPYSIGGHDLATSVSIGIAVYPENGEHMSDLLRNADAAMYAAKEQGRNRFQFYTQSMNVRARERLSLEGELRTAVEREQLYLVYQPQLDLKTGAVVGLEALLRWAHPARGDVPPAEFIPVAEDSGLIVKIGEWVLRRACAQNKHWRDTGIIDVPVAVNVSALQFRRAHFGKTIRSILAQTGLPARSLELELTESVVMEGPEVMAAMLQELHQQGVRLTIDDFGKGYSSLSYLRYMPIEQLKIDQTFVRDLPENGDSAVITQTIVTMARSLDLSVVAEGVERDEQTAFLAAAACNKVQGYLFCKPLPPGELEAWLATYTGRAGSRLTR